MGKLTDSLKNTSQRLNALQQGIRQMQSIGEELADNTLVVAEAALRAGGSATLWTRTPRAASR